MSSALQPLADALKAAYEQRDAKRLAPLLAPNSPSPSAPQQLMLPPESNAHAPKPPAEIATALVSPLTGTGVALLVTPPGGKPLFPNSPSPPWPQQSTLPPDSNAHSPKLPAEIAVALVIPLTDTGVKAVTSKGPAE